MARITDNLISKSSNLAVDGAGPISLDGLADHDHRTAIVRVPIFHGFERGDDLSVVVAVVESEYVPAIGSPLVGKPVAIESVGDDATEQTVVNARVIGGDEHAQPLAD